MNSSNTSAIRSIFALSLENFFESKTDKEIQELVLAPYREAHEDFERELSVMANSEKLLAA